jgi:hypothetical protein
MQAENLVHITRWSFDLLIGAPHRRKEKSLTPNVDVCEEEDRLRWMVLISLVPVGQRPGREQASAGREFSVVV